jgi:CP family cyanate transporter-like MFS transporter
VDISTPPNKTNNSISEANDSSQAATAVSGTLAIFAIVLVSLSLRPGIVAVGPILPSVIGEFKLSHAMASLLTSIPDLLMGLLALPTPWLARRFGRDPVILIGLLLLCVSIFGRAFSGGPLGLFLTTAGVGAGIAVVGALIAGFIKARFPAHASILMGIYATALSLGSTVSAAVTGLVAVESASGWRLASGMWSVLALLGVIGWLAVVLTERRHHASVPISPQRTRLPLGSPTAWLVALFFACDNFLFYALLSWTSPIYREVGLSPINAGIVLATFTAAFMVANPIFGWLSKSQDRRGWLAACAVIVLAGLAPTAIAPDFAPFIFIPLCAFGLGGAFTLGMTLPLDNTHSVDEANVWNAFVLTVGYLVASGGPLIVGRLRDSMGDFRLGLWLLVVISVIMIALTPFLHPRHRHGEM